MFLQQCYKENKGERAITAVRKLHTKQKVGSNRVKSPAFIGGETEAPQGQVVGCSSENIRSAARTSVEDEVVPRRPNLPEDRGHAGVPQSLRNRERGIDVPNRLETVYAGVNFPPKLGGAWTAEEEVAGGLRVPAALTCTRGRAVLGEEVDACAKAIDVDEV